VSTTESNVSCCIPDTRAGINGRGTSVSEDQYFVEYGMKGTWHEKSIRVLKLTFSVKRWGTTDRLHNYHHDTSC